MSQKKTGRVTVKIDGTPLRSKKGASLQIGGTQRETETDDQGNVYFTEKESAAKIEATMIHVADTDLEALSKLTNATLEYETDTGVLYAVRGAHTNEVGDLVNGEVKVTFSGSPAEKV